MMILSYYSFIKMHQNGINQETEWFINTEGMWTMAGFSIYCLAGIGMLMPIMSESAVPEQMDTLYAYGMITFCSLYLIQGSIAYLAFGNLNGIQAIT